jgi:molecular chaperone GrpE (heat shock protein)
MSSWVEDFGFTAVDEDTYRKRIVDQEKQLEAEKPPVAAKTDITELESRLEKKLDSLKNLEKKIDKVLSLAYDSENIVEERKQLADSVANQKVQALAEVVMPLLQSLYRTQNQRYIDWPNRGPVIKKQMEKVEAILDGTYFKDNGQSS